MTDRLSLAYAAFAATPRKDNESEHEWVDRVAVTAQVIATQTDPQYSPVMKAVAAVEDAKVFRATIMEVRKDQKAPRLQVVFYTTQNAQAGKSGDIYGQALPVGYEMIRTPAKFEKTLYEYVGKTAVSLIGHDVLMWKASEQFEHQGQTRKTRVLIHMKDLGVNQQCRIVTKTNKHGVDIPVKAEFVSQQ